MNGKSELASSNFLDARLTGGMFRDRLEATLEYYLGIDDEDLLWGFRDRAGRRAPGRQLHGWYGAGIYHVFGQILSGLVRLGRATEDGRATAKARRLLTGWVECLDEDGYGLHNARGKVFDQYYEYDKLVGGLADCVEFLGSDLARLSLSRLTDWARSNLDNSVNMRPYDAPPGLEWYTLSENLYRAFLLTGDVKYREFAASWEYPQYWDKFLDPGSFSSVRKHAYSHVNSLCGAALAYRVRGDERYLRIIRNAYDLLCPGHLYATGGFGPGERLFGEPGYLGESVLHALDDGYGHMEVSCGSWAVFKLCRYLTEFTGEARYADWAEKILYNCMAAEILPRPGGKVMYYADYYVLGARKTCDDGRTTGDGATFEWPCCSGTFPQAVAEFVNLAGFTGTRGFHITQYIPSRHRWMHAGHEVTLDMDTRYPEEDTVRIAVDTARPMAFTLSLRCPPWAPALDVDVNEETAVCRRKGAWIVVDRTWRSGDTVRVRIPMTLRFEAVDRLHPGIVALLDGPVALASDSAGIMTGPVSEPTSWIERGPAGFLRYMTMPDRLLAYPGRKKCFKPYYGFVEGETYYLYNRIEAGGRQP